MCKYKFSDYIKNTEKKRMYWKQSENKTLNEINTPKKKQSMSKWNWKKNDREKKTHTHKCRINSEGINNKLCVLGYWFYNELHWTLSCFFFWTNEKRRRRKAVELDVSYLPAHLPNNRPIVNGLKTYISILPTCQIAFQMPSIIE